MSRTRKPTVSTSCPANRYAGAGEVIAEISSDVGGGEIAVRQVDGHLLIDLYRLDDTVMIRTPAGNVLRGTEPTR